MRYLVHRVILIRFVRVIWEKYEVLHRETYYKMCARLVARQFLFFFTPYMKKLYGIHDTVDKRNQLKIRQYLTFKAQTYSKTL